MDSAIKKDPVGKLKAPMRANYSLVKASCSLASLLHSLRLRFRSVRTRTRTSRYRVAHRLISSTGGPGSEVTRASIESLLRAYSRELSATNELAKLAESNVIESRDKVEGSGQAMIN